MAKPADTPDPTNEIQVAEEVAQLQTTIAAEKPSQMLMMLINGTVQAEGSINREVLTDLWQMQKEARQLDQKQEYEEGMAIFASLKRTIGKNRDGHVNSYADYPQLVETITPWLSAGGLSFNHKQDAPVMAEDGRIAFVMVHCYISHKGGHTSEPHSMPAIPDYENRNAKALSPSQQLQAAVTYAERQTLKMALGVAEGVDGVLDQDALTGEPPAKEMVQKKEPAKKPAAKGKKAPAKSDEPKATAAQIKMIQGKANNAGVDVEGEFGPLESVPRPKVNEVLKWIEEQADN